MTSLYTMFWRCADAFGRILSGTVKPGDKVRVLGEAYTPEDEEDSAVAEVSNVWVYQARYRIPLTKGVAGESLLSPCWASKQKPCVQVPMAVKVC